MDFVAFEHDRPLVIEALRRGEVDYLEHVSEAAEADLFRHYCAFHCDSDSKKRLRWLFGDSLRRVGCRTSDKADFMPTP